MRQTRSRNRAEVQASALEAAVFRLKRHHLLDQTPTDPVTLCRDICGTQAQILPAAYLQFWTRSHGITRPEIESALWKSHSLVRTHVMRQTLHLIPADEFPLYVAALRSYLLAFALRIMARCGVTREEADALTELIMEFMAAGPRTRTEIRAAVRPKVSKRVRAWMDKVWSIVRIPVAEGMLCYGSGEGNEVQLVRTDRWLPKMKACALSEGEAQCALLRKYLHAYGPATLNDFAHWSGLPVTQVRPLRAGLGEELTELELEGETCLLLQEDLDVLKSPATMGPSVRLLPHFDPYLLAHRGKDHLLENRHYKRVYRNQGWISPVLLLNGRIAGTWSYKLQGRRVQVTIEPFTKLPHAAREATAKEAESLAGYLGGTLELAFNRPAATKK
jgi:hypothetical protein